MVITDRERGSAEVLGLVLITPMVVAVAVVVVMVGLNVDRDAAARAGAAVGAQAAALERNHDAARRSADAVVRAMADPRGSCPEPSVGVDLTDHRPDGVVVVTVQCGTAIGRSIAVVDRFRWSTP